jgi:HPt (histidine-containing phosphotransfer) domain-containing protein
MDEKALLLALSRRLLERSRAEALDMGLALERGDHASIASTAHRLAGAAGAMGFEALGDVGRRLQRAAEARDALAVAEQLRTLGHELERLRDL